MENYDGFIKMNESANEIALLSNLYSFYLQKYADKKIFKTKFKDQVIFLYNQGEISKKSLTKFFKDNGMTIAEDINGVKVSVKDKLKSTPSYSDDGCGSSYNAGCGSAPISHTSRIYRDNSCGSSSSNAGC